uniref:Uncharacterized protein n=1 Tax=Globodera rostochiensis TaxID=31243 RepID=A0A914I2I7_GLORO
MNQKILYLLVSIFTIVWATNLPKTPQEKDSGGPSRNQPKFNHSKQSAFHKVVPKSSKQSDKIKTNEVEADQSKQSDKIKTNEVEADQSKQSDKIETNEVEADQSKQSDKIETNEVEADQSKQSDKNETNEVEADQSKQSDKIETNEMEADQSKQSDKIETNEMEADQNQTDRMELSAKKSSHAQTSSNESSKRQPDKSGDEPNQSSEATLSVGENENEPGKRRRLANKQQMRQMDESIDGEGNEKMDAEMAGDAAPSDRRRKAVASTDRSINSEPPKNTENSPAPSMSHHQLESQIRQQSQQLIQLDQKMEKILRMLPEQQQRSQAQQQHHQQAQQEQQVHEPQQLPQPQSLQHSTWLQRYNRMLGGQSLQSSADAQQQSQVQNQQQAKMKNFLAQLKQHNQLQQPSQSQIQPTQLQSGSIQHSPQRQRQSPRSMAQHQLHPLASLPTPMPQLQVSSLSMPQLQGSSLSMPQQRASSSSMPLPLPQQRPSPSSSMPLPQQRPSSSSMPLLQQRPSSSSMPLPQQRPSSSSMPLLQQRPSSSSMPLLQQRPSSSSMPLPQQRPSSSSMPLPQQRPSSSSMPLPQQRTSSSSSMLQQQLTHQLHHSQTVHELVKQKQQELPIPPVVGGILESSANNSMQQPVDKGKQHSARVGAVGQLPTPTSAPSFALPGTSDQLLPVNLAVNEAGTSSNAEQTTVSLRKLYLMIVEAIVKRAAMKSISIIQLSLKNYGCVGHPALVGLNFVSPEHANKLAMAIDVVKVAETNTAQFVIDQMKKENADAQITQILEEIGEECADFERHMKARTANWEDAKNQQMLRENNFLLAFGRLYYKLFFLLTTAFGPNALQQESDVKKLLVWTDTMRKEIFKNLKNSEAQNPEVSKWCESLFQLEITNDLAKLAIKLTGYAAENNAMFNSFVVCKLTALLDTIVTRTNSLIPRQDMRETANLNNLVLISALFRKLIADFETANNDVIRLAKLREESKSAQNILELCLSLLDAKFNEFKKNALDTINALDVIRKGITEVDEGANAQSK